MSTERQLQYMSYHQQTSRNVLAALYESDQDEAGGALPASDDADSAGLSFGEREHRVWRHRQQTEQTARSREDLLTRQEDQNSRQREPAEQERQRQYQEAEGGRRAMEVTEAERRSARASHSQERDTWRETRRQHQSSQILLGFGSTTARWEASADMGRRCTSSSQIDSAGHRAPLDEEPSARRHRSDLTPTVPGGQSFRDPPPPRHRSPGLSGSSGSRPSSAMSQQSGAAGARPSPLRLRTGPRRQRPVSIAGLPSRLAADTGKQEAEVSRTPSRSGSASTPRRPLPASAPTTEQRRPAPAAAASPRRTPAQVKADDARKKKQRSKSGTPQPSEPRAAAQPEPAEVQQGVSVDSESSASPEPPAAGAEGATEPGEGATEPREGATEPREASPARPPAVTVQPSTPQPGRAAAAEQTDGSAPGERRRAGYDSEAGARAALAEKRRQAREEADRQAELERQRQEEEERQEQERLRQEEEQFQREEQEQMRLMEEAAHAEQERLQRAIQEAEERRAAEERLRQEEEQQRQQREQEEAAAREEAERARIAAAEKLQREEAERKERRSRVAAIMSRTRTSNAAEKTEDPEVEDEPAPTESEMKVAPAHQEQELPMSTDSSPAHTNGINGTSGTNGTNGTNGNNDSDDDAGPGPTPAGDGHTNGTILPPLHSLVIKPAASDDEDSLNSNVSPPIHASAGLTGGPPPELGHAPQMTELVQL